jgi:transcriptional regulator with XRE-family HTH domain
VQSRRSRQPSRALEDLFGEALREYRRKADLTQEELAFRSGYHPTYIGQLERGKKSPSLRAIMGLADVLKIRGSELLRHVELLQSEKS